MEKKEKILIGNKRNRNDIPSESDIYQEMGTPDISSDKINYFLSQIKPMYETGVNYSFSFSDVKDKPINNVIAICLWGLLPLYEGRVLNFSKKINIETISRSPYFNKVEGVFDFFSNIQCLFYMEPDNYKKLSFLEDGKCGYIFEGKKDYYLLINIKSLKKFKHIEKNDNYCQFWLIKIENKNILDKLELSPKMKMVEEMEKKISDYKRIIDEKERYLENERKAYTDRINKIIKTKDDQFAELKSKHQKEIEEKNEIIEQLKLETKMLKRTRRFVGLESRSESRLFIKDETNVISYEEVEEESKENKDDDKDPSLNQDFSCILCCIRVRNIFFDKCHHCCVCDQCLEKCYHKSNKKTNQKEYFCPICNNDTQKDDQNSFTESKKIFFV